MRKSDAIIALVKELLKNGHVEINRTPEFMKDELIFKLPEEDDAKEKIEKLAKIIDES